MEDRVKAGLRGPVESCRTDQMIYITRCGAAGCDIQPEERRYSATSRYRRDGQLAEYRQPNPDGSEWASLYAYDAIGRLHEVDIGPGGKSIYQYDHLGHLERVITEAADGSQRMDEPFSYDEQNRKSRTLYIEPLAAEIYTAAVCGIEGSDAAYSARGATSMTTLYNERDQAIEVQFRDSQNRVLSRVTLLYDATGRLVEECQTTEVREFPPAEIRARMSPAQSRALEELLGNFQQRRVHAYDAEGRCVETRSTMAPFGEDRKTVTYNEHGDPSQESWYCEHKGSSIDEDGHLVEQVEPSNTRPVGSEVRFTYTYDEQSNWTERVTSIRQQPDQPYRVSSIDRRILTYYQD